MSRQTGRRYWFGPNRQSHDFLGRPLVLGVADSLPFFHPSSGDSRHRGEAWLAPLPSLKAAISFRRTPSIAAAVVVPSLDFVAWLLSRDAGMRVQSRPSILHARSRTDEFYEQEKGPRSRGLPITSRIQRQYRNSTTKMPPWLRQPGRAGGEWTGGGLGQVQYLLATIDGAAASEVGKVVAKQ